MRPLKFLIVDDEPMNLMALEGILNAYGISSVVQAYNGQQGLDVIKENQFNFDVVITDFHMPLMNGLDFAREVRTL